MKHFIVFIIAIFSGLTFFYFNKQEKSKLNEDQTIKVFASSSFIAKWGPGPELKLAFDRLSNFKVEFVESPDLGMTLQKINFEKENSQADAVLGLDQFDIARTASKIKWRNLQFDFKASVSSDFISQNESILNQDQFVPYDWAPMSFVLRKDLSTEVASLDDLLKPEFKGKLALQDPRTSSPGLQFLAWVFESKSEADAIAFLKKMNSQAHSFSSGWSAAYGLFKNKQADLVFSYVTSPLYHEIEEKDSSFTAIEMKEPLQAQVEFAGIPASCRNCEGAEKFLEFLLSKEAQKIIMNKNYMMPVLDQVKESTLFDALKKYRTNPVKFYDQEIVTKWINLWTEIRKNEN